MKELMEERSRLVERLKYLNVRSTGSDRIEARIREIDRQLNRK